MPDFMYQIIIAPDVEDGGFLAIVPDLQGCMGDGDTPEAAAADVVEAARAWLEVQAERGGEIPEPGEEATSWEAEIQQRDDRIAELEARLRDAQAQIRKMRTGAGIKVGAFRPKDFKTAV